MRLAVPFAVGVRVLRTACFVALGWASVAHAGGPSRNVDTYSLLAGRKLLARGLGLENGNVGVLGVERNTPTMALTGSLSGSKKWSAVLVAYH